MRLAGLILAAGESRRMGRAKALLDYRGETFLDRLIGQFARLTDPVIVVLGAEAERIRAGIERAHEASIAINDDYRLGQVTSMQCGLRALPPHVEGVLFTLVDHPAVSDATLERLVVGKIPLLRIPRFEGKRGHPVVFGWELIGEFLALPPDGAARDVVRLHLEEAELVDVDDAGVVADIDDPAAYRRLTGGAE